MKCTKKIISMLAVIALMIGGLMGCSQDEKSNVAEPATENQDKGIEPDNNGNTTEPANQDNDTNQPSDPAGDTDSNSAPNTPTSNIPDTVYQNDVFKDVIVSTSGDEIKVTGKAQVFEGVFQYALYDGDNAIIEDHYQTDGAPAWGKFEITFNKDQLPSSQATLELFVYSAKDGAKVNRLEIEISK